MVDQPHLDEQSTLSSGIRAAGTGSAVNILLGVVSALVVSRLYGPAVLGQFALAIAAVALVSEFSSVSERTALVRVLALRAPKTEDGSSLALATMGLSLLLTVVVAAAVAVASALFLVHAADQPVVVGPMLALVAGYVVLDNTSWNFDGVLSAHGVAGPVIAGRVVYSAVLAAVSVLLAPFSRSVWSLTIASLVASFAALTYRVPHIRRCLLFRVPLASFVDGIRQLPDIVRFGLRVLPGSLAEGLTNQLSTWVLGATAPIATVGAFSRAQSITIRVSDVTYRLSAVIYPSFVREATQGTGATFAATVTHTFRTTFAPFLIGACAAAGASHTILLLFGRDFVTAQGALALLLVAAALALGDMILSEALTAQDRPHLSSLGGVSRMVVAAAAIIPLTKAFGATGAAAALLLGGVVAFVVHAVALARITPGIWGGHHIARGAVLLALAAGASFAAVYAVQELLGSTAVLALGAGLAAAFGLVLTLRRRRKPHLRPATPDAT